MPRLELGCLTYGNLGAQSWRIKIFARSPRLSSLTANQLMKSNVIFPKNSKDFKFVRYVSNIFNKI